MLLLSPLLVKLYIFNIFKLPLDADPIPALDEFCCCLPLNSLQFPHINLKTRCLRLTAPVQVHLVFGGYCFWIELKKKKQQSFSKGICFVVFSLRALFHDGISGLALDMEMRACVLLRSCSLLSSGREMEKGKRG